MPVAVPTELLRQDQKLPHWEEEHEEQEEETLHYEQLQRHCFLDQLSRQVAPPIPSQ